MPGVCINTVLVDTVLEAELLSNADKANVKSASVVPVSLKVFPVPDIV